MHEVFAPQLGQISIDSSTTSVMVFPLFLHEPWQGQREQRKHCDYPENHFLARSAGVNVETVRYYQRVGILSQLAKPLRYARKYGPRDIKQIRFIKRAQALGFTLSEVAELLALGKVSSCRETQVLAEIKLESIGARINDLIKMQETLLQLVARCNAMYESTGCPIIDALVGDE